MTAIHPLPTERHSDPMTTALLAALALEQHKPGDPKLAPQPFVTISRQAGAGGKTFGRALVDRLDTIYPVGPRWTLWDDELVQKVAQEHALAEEYILALEDQPHGWFADFLRGLPFNGTGRHPDEFKVYRRVATTIRALAHAGRTVIVGRGGAFIAGDVAGGVHLRIIAPIDFRVRELARRLDISDDDAANRIQEIESNRTTFYKHYWPNRPMDPQSFSMTLNSAKIETAQMVECVLPLLTQHGKCTSGGGCSCTGKNFA